MIKSKFSVGDEVIVVDSPAREMVRGLIPIHNEGMSFRIFRCERSGPRWVYYVTEGESWSERFLELSIREKLKLL
ncbi:MAG: hypothetical protein HQ541_03070 [Mariniphaga sp.]|nr:hypothetical protein [Mariniphaga sp.]